MVPVMAADIPRPPQSVFVGRYPQLIAMRYVSGKELPAGAVEAIRSEKDRIFAKIGGSTLVLDGGRWRTATPSDRIPQFGSGEEGPNGAMLTSQARTRDGEIWATTASGAFRKKDGQWTVLDIPRVYAVRQVMPDIDMVIRRVLADPSGHIWLVTDRGAYLTDGQGWWHPLDHHDGMPYVVMTCMAIAPNGDLWGGTSEGAWRLRAGQWRYFWGRRWLPGNNVADITVDDRGRVWLATDAGIACIEEREMSLADKALHYDAITQQRHNRNGWISDCRFETPGEPDKGVIHHASDNDGLWTSIYVAAESFRYAVDKSAEARANASKSLQALLDLVRLSGYPGFPARAIIKKGEKVTGYQPHETVRVDGETDPIWYASPSHPEYICKGDTSSDELDGHYFAWYVYYECVANKEEKKQIADVCRAVTDNLLRNGFTLVGHTGRKTRWGVFAPEYLNEDPRWVDERGLNSLEMLCYLKVAHHICGDQRFADAYEKLISEHHYLINTLLYRHRAIWYRINFSDDELAFCTFYPLILLETRPERRAVLLESLATSWKGLREENRAWYNIQYAALAGGIDRLDRAVECLQDWPYELIEWKVRNSHRHDVELRYAPGRGGPWLDRVLPFSELRIMRWNGNAYEPDGGGDGSSEDDGGAWLLAYWMGRYHGLIRH